MLVSRNRVVRRVGVLTVVALLATACSGAVPQVVSQSRPVVPSKRVTPAYDEGDRRYYSYWGFGAATAEEAHALAFDNILTRQIPVELGVEVSGATAVREVEKDGSYSYRFERIGTTKSAPVRFEGVRVEDRYEECIRQSGEVKCNGFVLLSISHAQLLLARRALAGRTVLQVSCDAGKCCDAKAIERLRAAGAQAGFSLTDRTEYGDAAVEEIADRAEAAQVLRVRLRSREIGSSEGAYFAMGSGSVRLVDCLCNKVKAELDVPEEKAGDYDRKGALCRALQDAVDRLASRIQAGMLSPEEAQ